MDDLRRAFAGLDSIGAPDLWPDIERRAAASAPVARPRAGQVPTVLRAAEFVVAGAVVALVGGFVLTGLWAQPSGELVPALGASPSADAAPTDAPTVPPSPMTMAKADDPVTTLLPGVELVTEEIMPGVFRVVGDGVRELHWDPASGGTIWGDGRDRLRTVVGRDGSVWQFKQAGATGADGCGGDDCLAFYRLGSPETRHLGQRYFRWGDIEIAADGVVWAVVGRADPDGLGAELRSFDGARWTRQTHRSMKPIRVVLDADGAIWSSWSREANGNALLGRLAEEQWDVLERGIDPESLLAHPQYGVVVADREGNLRRLGEFGDAGDLIRLDDTALAGLDVVAGEDGGFWWLTSPRPDAWQLVRYGDRGAWATHDAPVDLRHYEVAAISPAGVVWLMPQLTRDCDGVLVFDGSAWTRLMEGYCPLSLGLGPDGSAWLQAIRGEVDLNEPQDGPVGPAEGLIETYVITREAIDAAERRGQGG